MKKVYVISAVILALLLTGCEKNTPSGIPEIEENPFIQTRAMPDTAHSKALELLSESPYSHAGLVEALENIGFPHDEATDAADRCGADWNEQALQTAKKELYMYPYSYEKLIKNLEEWKDFTREQAIYATDSCGADWNEQAVEKLEYYIDFFDEMTREEMLQALADDGFTDEQIAYEAEQREIKSIKGTRTVTSRAGLIYHVSVRAASQTLNLIVKC